MEVKQTIKTILKLIPYQNQRLSDGHKRQDDDILH